MGQVNRDHPVVILGVHDGHNAGAALVKDGKVVAAISEERLTNEKNHSGVPEQAIRRVFDISGVAPGEVTQVAIGCLMRLTAPLREEYTLKARLKKRLAPVTGKEPLTGRLVKVAHRLSKREDLHRTLERVGLGGCDTTYVEHHLTHAACAYYTRPWDGETLVLTLDGAGDGVSSSVNVGSGNRIERIAWSTFFGFLFFLFISMQWSRKRNALSLS